MDDTGRPIEQDLHLRSGGCGRIFAHLTLKQHEVLVRIAENRTSKEIAWELGISESAVNQRIEGVRVRLGSPSRAEVARAYRQYLQDRSATCNSIPGKNLQVPEGTLADDAEARDARARYFARIETLSGKAPPRPPQREFGRFVPEVLDGVNAGLSRTAATVVIALGMLLVAVVGLSLARALTELM
ncbi:LuxR C-terminal-related transcriptional regulator [Novosphingobium soli]|uniref:LuxR C-terminal-related transcriptional regulator n=1 Tax=Novosphingobium soli TaxID=574956 RepID=A0ABV6CXL2_9SPHN